MNTAAFILAILGIVAAAAGIIFFLFSKNREKETVLNDIEQINENLKRIGVPKEKNTIFSLLGEIHTLLQPSLGKAALQGPWAASQRQPVSISRQISDICDAVSQLQQSLPDLSNTATKSDIDGIIKNNLQNLELDSSLQDDLRAIRTALENSGLCRFENSPLAKECRQQVKDSWEQLLMFFMELSQTLKSPACAQKGASEVSSGIWKFKEIIETVQNLQKDAKNCKIFQGQNKMLTDEKVKLQEVNDKLQSENGRLKNGNDNLQRGNTALQSEVTQLQTVNGKLNEDVSKLRGELQCITGKKDAEMEEKLRVEREYYSVVMPLEILTVFGLNREALSTAEPKLQPVRAYQNLCADLHSADFIRRFRNFEQDLRSGFSENEWTAVRNRLQTDLNQRLRQAGVAISIGWAAVGSQFDPSKQSAVTSGGNTVSKVLEASIWYQEGGSTVCAKGRVETTV